MLAAHDMRPLARNKSASALIVFGLFILWGFGFETVWPWLSLDVNGVIVASSDIPSKGAPRYATQYTFRAADGTEYSVWAGPTDGSLPRSMPVGTRIRKQRWHLEYERDGSRAEFPYIFYGIILAIGFGVLLQGLRLL